MVYILIVQTILTAKNSTPPQNWTADQIPLESFIQLSMTPCCIERDVFEATQLHCCMPWTFTRLQVVSGYRGLAQRRAVQELRTFSTWQPHYTQPTNSDTRRGASSIRTSFIMSLCLRELHATASPFNTSLSSPTLVQERSPFPHQNARSNLAAMKIHRLPLPNLHRDLQSTIISLMMTKDVTGPPSLHFLNANVRTSRSDWNLQHLPEGPCVSLS